MSSTAPLERRRRASPSRWRRAATWVGAIVAIGVAPFACELTTDLDELRGPASPGGNGGTGGTGGTGGQVSTASSSGQTSAGGGAGRSTYEVVYASSADVGTITYDGDCKESFWREKANEIEWYSRDYDVRTTCYFAWGPTPGNERARTIYGCCGVKEPSVSPIHADPCVTYQSDGVEYLFAKGAKSGDDQTLAILSAWGSSCGKKAVAFVDIHGTKHGSSAEHINCFKPVLGKPCPDDAANAKAFNLEWALDLDPSFSTEDDRVLCTFGVRSALLPSHDDLPGQLTSGKSDGLTADPSTWADCTFEPRPDGG